MNIQLVHWNSVGMNALIKMDDEYALHCSNQGQSEEEWCEDVEYSIMKEIRGEVRGDLYERESIHTRLICLKFNHFFTGFKTHHAEFLGNLLSRLDDEYIEKKNQKKVASENTLEFVKKYVENARIYPPGMMCKQELLDKYEKEIFEIVERTFMDSDVDQYNIAVEHHDKEQEIYKITYDHTGEFFVKFEDAVPNGKIKYWGLTWSEEKTMRINPGAWRTKED